MAWSNGYSYRRTITIDHTKCGSSDSTDWPFYFTGHADLKTTGNGGYVTNANGYDIIFTSDAAGSNTLSYERVSWSASTGLGEFHIKIPTLAAASDTVIYLWYGNSNVTTDQSNKTGTWNSNFRAVYHFGDGATLSGSDATSNGETLTNYSATADTGKIGGAVRCSSTPTYIAQSDNTTGGAGPTNNFLLSAWIKINSMVTTWSQDVYTGWGAGGPRIFVGDGSGRNPKFWNGVQTSTKLPLGTWKHLAVRGSGGTYTYYVDGVAESTTITTAPSSASYGHFLIGYDFDDSSNKMDGWVDEARFSNNARSVSWVVADYNSQSSPSTFYTVGAADSGLSIPVLAYHHNRRRLQ